MIYTVMCVLCNLVIYNIIILLFFFFKQKTAYEMRISDWSSDVCSSDLGLRPANSPNYSRQRRPRGSGRSVSPRQNRDKRYPVRRQRCACRPLRPQSLSSPILGRANADLSERHAAHSRHPVRHRLVIDLLTAQPVTSSDRSNRNPINDFQAAIAGIFPKFGRGHRNERSELPGLELGNYLLVEGCVDLSMPLDVYPVTKAARCQHDRSFIRRNVVRDPLVDDLAKKRAPSWRWSRVHVGVDQDRDDGHCSLRIDKHQWDHDTVVRSQLLRLRQVEPVSGTRA